MPSGWLNTFLQDLLCARHRLGRNYGAHLLLEGALTALEGAVLIQCPVWLIVSVDQPPLGAQHLPPQKCSTGSEPG